MKIISAIGLLSFGTIISVMLEQYFVMDSDISTFNYDLEFMHWASSYSNYLSNIKQFYNVYELIESNYFLSF